MAILPKAFRLKLQGRLLLLCLGAVLPIATVFALSLFDQWHIAKDRIEQVQKAELFALIKSFEIWGKQEFLDLNSFANQPIIQTDQKSNHNLNPAKSLIDQTMKRHPEWDELYRIFPDGRAIVYFPTKEAVIRLPYNAKEILSLIIKEHKGILYGFSPLSGKEKLLLVKDTKKEKSYTILVAAISPKSLSSVLSTRLQELNNYLDNASSLFYFALADGKGRIFAQSTEDISSTQNSPIKYELEKFVPSLGLSIMVAPAPSGMQQMVIEKFSRTVILALIALIASSYLAFSASKQFSRQIKLLVKEVLALGHGDFSKRLEITSNDELGKLAKAFNQIAAKMQLEHDHRILEEKISLAIRQSLDMDQVLISTVTELGKALGASRVCLALLDLPKSKENKNAQEKNLELIFDYVWNDEIKSGNPLTNRVLHLEEKSIMNMIIEQGSILSMDALDENGPTPLFENGRSAPEDWRSIKSLIACPITSAEGTLGLILIQQCDQVRTWTDKELELVEVVTRQLTVAMQHAHLYYYTRTMAEQEMLINQIVRCVRSSLDLDTILNTVTKELCAAIGADRCQILQPGAGGPLVVSHEYHNDGLPDTKGINLYAQQIDFNPSETEAVFTQGNFLLGIDLQKLSRRGTDINVDNISKGQSYDPWLVAVIGDTESDARAIAFKYFILSSTSRSLIAAPLLNGNRIIGLLVVHQCDNSRTWRSGEVQLVSAIADQLALAATQAHLYAQVKYQAITDGLTGLYNHVYFKNRLAEELRLANRKNLPCSLLMLDLDHLKHINDTYGHPVGDAAIRQVGSALKTLLRSGDTAARYGGEEFAVILPETSLLEAALIGDRLCTHIANMKMPGLAQITISVGAASYPRQAKDADELIYKADQALYEAKKSGRNQIWISESVSQSALTSGQIVPEFRVTRRLALASGRKDEDTLSVNAYRQTKTE